MRRTVLGIGLGVAAVGLVASRFVGPIGMLLLVGAVLVTMVLLIGGSGAAVPQDRPTVRLTQPRPQPRPAPAPAPAPSGRALWERARSRHDEVLSEYGSYELDPEMLLRFPAMWDFSSPKVIAFQDALEHAGALRTDTYPSDDDAAAYVAAVTDLRTAWYAADRHARSTGTGGLADADARDLDRGLKLYRHAASAEAAEKAAYLDQVVSTVDRLVDRGVLPAPPKFRAELQAQARRAIDG